MDLFGCYLDLLSLCGAGDVERSQPKLLTLCQFRRFLQNDLVNHGVLRGGCGFFAAKTRLLDLGAQRQAIR